MKLQKAKQSLQYNNGAKELEELCPGDTVRLQPQKSKFGKKTDWTQARVEGKVDIRSYQVRTEDGRLYKRNRRHLRRTREVTPRGRDEIGPPPREEPTTATANASGGKRANLSVWWPGISKEIKAKVESCQFCQENQTSQRKEPLMTTDLPDRPWQVSTDLFELASQKYLVVMDYYSRFIEILSLVETTSQVFIQKLKSVFARWGIPEELISDNGTQFKSLHFDEFKAKYGFKHTTSSPHHPQANGMAESGVQIAKRILKQEEPFLALMAYRATPTPATGKTPSELITGRLIRTTLPTLTKNLEPKLPNHTAIKRADIKAKRGYKESFDKRNDAR